MHKKDYLLLVGLLLVGAVIALATLLHGASGDTVQVKVDGVPVATFSLQEDRSYLIEGADGGTNLLLIQDGYAWVEEASCPDGLCMHMGKIHRDGQSVICLPNKVVVEIVSGEGGLTEDPNSVDGIVK